MSFVVVNEIVRFDNVQTFGLSDSLLLCDVTITVWLISLSLSSLSKYYHGFIFKMQDI